MGQGSPARRFSFSLVPYTPARPHLFFRKPARHVRFQRHGQMQSASLSSNEATGLPSLLVEGLIDCRLSCGG
jgi:hypothetical protein